MHRPTLLLTLVALAAAVEVEPAKLATADAAPLDPGVVELAFGGTWSTASRARDSDGQPANRGGRLDQRSVGAGITYGLIPGLDAGIALAWSAVCDTASDPGTGSGLSDLEVGAKWAFWTTAGDASDWSLALLPGMTVPCGRGHDADEAISTATRCWTAGLTVAGSGHLGMIGFNADAGYSHAYGSADSCDGYLGTLAANIAMGVQISDEIQPEVELSWARDRTDGDDAPWSLVTTVGAQLALPFGRLGVGVQHVIAGALVDETTTVLADLAITLE